jgi:hypothetical protein
MAKMTKLDFTFSRYEEKYLLDKKQHEAILAFLPEITIPDAFAEYRVNNIYYDTETYDVIRRSIEKPIYKEKLRLRYYGEFSGGVPHDQQVFLELKKKFSGVVYKRRIMLDKSDAERVLSEPGAPCTGGEFTQVRQEIQHFLASIPAITNEVIISYRRTALTGRDDENLRVTFDTDVVLRDGQKSCNLMQDELMLMEIKTATAMPLALARFLSAHAIYPANYSKYKTAYINYIYPSLRGEKKQYG